jgi:hypothetical protein
MSDNSVDPAGNTEAFRAFSQAPHEQQPRSAIPLLVGGVIVLVLVVAVIAWLAL